MYSTYFTVHIYEPIADRTIGYMHTYIHIEEEKTKNSSWPVSVKIFSFSTSFLFGGGESFAQNSVKILF